MSKNIIELFVMKDCQVCPQMEKVFHKLHQKGAIDELNIIDVGDQPDMAKQYNIRSVPHYLINNVAFNGLKTMTEISQLLSQSEQEKWSEFITSELSEGQLVSVETEIKQSFSARQAMIKLLQDVKTTLVVRIGLSAIIESLADTGVFNEFEENFINMTSHPDERISIDAIYYLSLLATHNSLNKLMDIAENGEYKLKVQATEVLQELSTQASVH